MGVDDHWQFQGRQEHGWFGHGVAPDKTGNAGLDLPVISKSIDDRALALAYGAIAALPAPPRRRAEAQYQHGTFPSLKKALTAWIRGARLEQNVFAARLFGRAADDPVARTLRSAALVAAAATSQADIGHAAGKLADAIKAVGVDQWPRFVADALKRADDPSTQAAIEASSQPPSHAPDAIRPVYLVETAIGIAVPGLVSGARAAARAFGGAILKQMLPESGASTPSKADQRPATTPPSGGSPKAAGSDQPVRLHEGQQGKHIEATNNYIPGRSTLIGDPKVLLKRFAGQGKQVGRIPVGQAGSKEVFDAGETIGTFRTEAGRSAPTTRGMIHYSNKGAHIVPSAPRNWRP